MAKPNIEYEVVNSVGTWFRSTTHLVTAKKWARELGGGRVYKYSPKYGKVLVYQHKQTNPVSSLTGKWIPAHAVRILPTGQVQVLKEKNPGKLRNIEEGFRDANGIFHPIRASEDYDEGLVGTHPVASRSRKKKATTKKKAKGKKKQ